MNTILTIIYQAFDNAAYVGVLALVFLTTTALILAIYFLLTRKNMLQKRLGHLMPEKETTTTKRPKLLDKQESGFVVKITKPLHEVASPQDGGAQKKLRGKLIRAGFRSEGAVRNYVAAKVMLAVLFPGAYLFSLFFFTFTPQVLLFSAILALCGFFLPNVFILHHTQARQQKISKALPDALDLMVVCVEAGLGLDMTFKRVGDEIRPLSKDLSDEFHLTTLEIRAGKPRDESFKNMTLRTGVAEIGNLMTVLIQTSRFGTSMAKALRVHADAMRVKRRQLAEEQAAKSSVKLVFPLIMFIFPALIAVLVGPAAIRIIRVLFPALGG